MVAMDVEEKKQHSNSSNLQEKPPWWCLTDCQWKIGLTKKTSMNLETYRRRRMVIVEEGGLRDGVGEQRGAVLNQMSNGVLWQVSGRAEDRMES